MADDYRGADCYAHSYINYWDPNADEYPDPDAYPHSNTDAHPNFDADTYPHCNANGYGNIGAMAERSPTSVRRRASSPCHLGGVGLAEPKTVDSRLAIEDYPLGEES